jgi:polynucleotide kinase-phosphatase
MVIFLPDPCLVVLIGPSGSGKSTFARRHFRPTEVLSSDFFRGLVSDSEADQSASGDAFELLHLAAAKRLNRRRLTVADATSIQTAPRQALLAIARRCHLPACAVVFDLPEDVCHDHNQKRPGRVVGEKVVRLHQQQLQRAVADVAKERFHQVSVLRSPEEVAAVSIQRRPLPGDRRDEAGPFDLIGDVHGCFAELAALLSVLGYEISPRADTSGEAGYVVRPPPGRRAVFVGDLVDRGPLVPEVLRLVMDMVAAGAALCVNGNHDDKLRRRFEGRNVTVSHGLAETLAQIEGESDSFKRRVHLFLQGLEAHLWLDGGRLVVAHAGLPEHLHGRLSKRVRDFALYGLTTGTVGEDGLPVRGDWAADYRGRAAVVYGHTPVEAPVWVNGTLNVDTGCVFGGRLTALRWPEKEVVAVPAARTYCEPKRAFLALGPEEENDG